MCADELLGLSLPNLPGEPEGKTMITLEGSDEVVKAEVPTKCLECGQGMSIVGKPALLLVS